MSRLDGWLNQATRTLSRDSAARVRNEIQEHYELALSAALAEGADQATADRLGVEALGDAKQVNAQYRRVLLTSSEAKLLGKGDWEARAVCRRPWLKRLFLAIPIAAALVSMALFFAGKVSLAFDILPLAIAMMPLAAAPFLPINTPTRGNVFRSVKWLAMGGAVLLAYWPDALKWSWLLFSCLWPLAQTEWKRASIRRKLPVAEWPRQLYF